VGSTAGQLIDRAGLKGYSVGGATVSPMHANFVTAEPGRTTSADILAVIEHVEDMVDKAFGVKLEREVVVWA
jgi:UDP-N-acetylmuramate dehydrogenase